MLKLKKTKLASILLVVFALQLSLASVSHAAAGEAALQLDGYFSYGGKGGMINVCNSGDETVQSLTLVNDTVGATLDEYIIAADVQKTPPTNPGTIQQNGNWVGLLETGQCLTVATGITPTVAVGQSTTPTFHVENSVLQGGTPNPFSGSTSNTFGTFVNESQPDIIITPRLTTTGTIQSGTNVNYEVTIKNIGEGLYPVAENITFAFLIPAAANYSQMTTVPAKSDVGMIVNFCQDLGDPVNASPNLAAYNGSLAYCNLNMTGDLNPGQKLVLNFEMQATTEFTSGSFFARVFAIGYDVDSLKFQTALIRPGADPFALDINNIAALEYNNEELQTTVNRCPGQTAVTTNGTGCFRVSFNKLIYAPEFTSNDLVLTGGGQVQTFTQIDDFTWQVTISGITPNSTLSLTLGAGGVQDYNAVVNGAQVLGENTIRYEVPSELGSVHARDVAAATGLLAETGKNEDLFTPILLLLLGSGLLLIAHKDRKALLRRLLRL